MLRIFGLPKDRRAAAARLLADHGFDSVTVGAAEDAAAIRPALEAGIEVWSCRAAFTIRQLPEGEAIPLLARDVDDLPQTWFGSGCPNQPALRDAHLLHIRRVAESGAFTGFMLDGIRFASPNAGDAFFTCFCPRCETKAQQLDFDFARMRSDVRALREWCRDTASTPLGSTPDTLVTPVVTRWPAVADWLRFREACIREHVQEVRASVDELTQRGHTFHLGAYLFATVFAPWVGQDYRALTPLLDVVSPMLYRTLTPGDSCLTTEWGALATLNLIPSHPEFAPREVGQQVRLAREATTPPTRLVPILQLVDDQLTDVIAAAKLATPDGLDFFTYRPGTESYLETISRGTRASI